MYHYLKNDTINDTRNSKRIIKEQIVLESILKDKYSTRENLSKKLGIPQATLGRIIQKLQKNELIERVGSNKKGYWRVLNK